MIHESNPHEMRNKFGEQDIFGSERANPSWLARNLPSTYFYGRIFPGPVRWLCAKAAKGQCDDSTWANSSAWFCDILEQSGCHIQIEGLDAVRKAPKPCVFVANHMSTLETFALPAIIRPICPVTFVVKKSLVTMPFFGPVMRSREPVVVERKNPRDDLATVLEDGPERLARGVSVIVFPQSTRSSSFEPAHFNSIGVKLARKAQVPVVPLALKTDAWGQGKKIKELGKIRPELPIRFKFGDPMEITGNGKEQQAEIVRFIGENIAAWQAMDGINS